MTRIIRFRGQKINTEEWVYGSLIITKHYVPINKEDDIRKPGIKVKEIDKYEINYLAYWDFGFPIYEICEVIPETVGQYTGFKDKNDKEIYENDWVILYDVYDLPQVDLKAQVVWHDGGWFIKYPFENKQGWELESFARDGDNNPSDFEVIKKSKDLNKLPHY